MAKDPAFLFYSSDFLTGTMFMTNEQVGKYIRILCAQHQLGHLSEKDMLNICISHDELIFSKFKKDEFGKFYNERCENEILKRKAYSESRSGNRKGKQKHMNNISKTYVKHMENENVIENENINIVRNENSKLDIFESLFSDQIFLEQLSITHKGKDLKSAFEECYTHHSNSPNPPREIWEWRQKLNSWLTIKGTQKQNKNAKQPTASTNEQISNLVDNYFAAKKSGSI